MQNSLEFKASKLHREAENLREKDKLDKALNVNTEAIEEYRSKKNWEGVVRSLQSRILVYKHKYLLTKEDKFLELAKKDATECLIIAKEHGLKFLLSSCNFRFGEISMLSKEFKSAISFFQNSVDLFTGNEAEKGDYTYHLGEATYKFGDKDHGKKLLLAGLALIQGNQDEVDPFLIHVWESGCYMKLAECLKKENLAKAKEYLLKAKKIIDEDPGLVIRKRQWDELSGKFG